MRADISFLFDRELLARVCGLAVAVLVCAGAAIAETRVWTARTGDTVEAELVGFERGQVTLRKSDGKMLGIPMGALSDADQLYVREQSGAQSGVMAPVVAVAAAPVVGGTTGGSLSLGGVDLKTGEQVTFLAPLPTNAVRALTKDKNTVVAEARVGIAVPQGFDPTKPQRVFVVSATSDGNSSSVDHARAYAKEALALGWVVLAADGPNNEKPTKINNVWRWGLIQAGLEEMHRVWPTSRTWAYATGGFSGGAKRSGYIAALMAAENYDMIGLYMGGCNQEMASDGLQNYGPKRSAFLRIPAFISNGTRDTVSTVQHAQGVRDSLRKTGFKFVRLETYDGAHSVYSAHTTDALGWFDELASKK